MSKDLECPYCGHEQDVCHDDGFGYEEYKRHEVECHFCEKWYVFTTYVSYSYTPEKAECLNTGEHNIKETRNENGHQEYIIIIRECKDCDYKEKTQWIKKEVNNESN